ncbi:LuxR C-terminal-related transcriptional regulator [Demequina sp. SYSU T00039]|uniref:LuxR C-terminal-related transcriptional regulator n=1 Tax=Demequina lignilytica TaxID=3051663 RepID=A0AAW7M557_9MICO|nr:MULTISPECIES: LuxR C-terminal-related transcriptional regulator [unclassified Demequina]MDN4478733.1 LuxR C-terminal-related transcriptional regulator [Demequina sp. SYSU T00039-1]MDN4488710.1 LuxR C-terminal-related transcriptional regulator [Demequina sp. SYSU T00039]
MPSLTGAELALGRARSDIDVMSRAGLPLHRFMDEAASTIERVIPISGGCLSTLDPATAMVSSTRKFAGLSGNNAGDVAWAHVEYGVEDPSSIEAMVRSGTTALGMHLSLDGAVESSVRMAELMLPVFDYRDEARAIFHDRHGAWGAISVFRGRDDAPFSRQELDFLAAIAPAFTRGIRAGLLSQLSAADAERATGPVVMIIDSADRLAQSSPGAAAQLERLSNAPSAGDPLTLVHALVAAARRYARCEADHLPRIRVRTGDGIWLVLHAAPLGGAADRAGDVVVTIEEARPQEVMGLVADAFGLTARERDVTTQVLRGADTKEIAAAMHVSPYTVQDHLKSIFDKAGVASRRELVSRVYFDQYVPRWGAEVAPGGFFAA